LLNEISAELTSAQRQQRQQQNGGIRRGCRRLHADKSQLCAFVA